MTLIVDTVPSPIGPLSLATDGRALVALEFGEIAALAPRLCARFGAAAAMREAADPLGLASRVRAYLEGDLGALASVPVDGGGTAFQRRVWTALREIPPGETSTYSALAARIGAPRACRAVGLANGRNPIAIAVPCHRVVGAGGALTGYAGGLERKRWLLAHEGARLPLETKGAADRAAPRLRGATLGANGVSESRSVV
jgi:methylated-DNA-[protein]-cysteine S-methyltransferase